MNASTSNLRPVIARIWRGRTTIAKADEYSDYLYESLVTFYPFGYPLSIRKLLPFFSRPR